jgi:PAS domain-containing protein
MSQESDHGAGIERLRERLAEAEEILDAIRRGRIDALVVDSPEGARIFTVAGAERPYRILIEQMGEGAASLSDEGVVLFANRQFATMLGVPESEVAGQCIDDFLSDEDGRASGSSVGRTCPKSGGSS